jgi:hypothetical protein
MSAHENELSRSKPHSQYRKVESDVACKGSCVVTFCTLNPRSHHVKELSSDKSTERLWDQPHQAELIYQVGSYKV